MNDQLSAPLNSDTFYAELKSFDDFASVSDLNHYAPAPPDWLVVIADIKGSTQAIGEGRYKDVNMVGAACITAVLNVSKGVDIPYVFGGDGATMLVPPSLYDAVRIALVKTKNLAQSGFGLSLRVGAAPVSAVRDLDVDVLVAKFRLSPGNFLAMFNGGGVAEVDTLIKQDDGTQGYVFDDPAGGDSPDLEGLSCRWEPLKAQRGIMLSMLVHAVSPDRTVASDTYLRVISDLTEGLGYDPPNNRPVTAENMKFKWPPRGLLAEARATQGDAGYWRRLAFITFQSLIQWFLEKFDKEAGGYNAPVYREELRDNSDYRRFDDTLRLVLDCSPKDVATIERVLQKLRDEGVIAFGLHQADSALMTCLVFNLIESEHVHFIDGGDGGFAMAAKQLKQQLAESKNST